MRVLVIDDHPLFRQGVCAVLQQIDIGYTCIEAETWKVAQHTLKNGMLPDLVLLDLKLPDIYGIDALMLLRASHPIIPVVILSASDDPATMRAALDGGALGFLPKSSSNEIMASAIQLVMAGGIYIPAEALITEKPNIGDIEGKQDGNFDSMTKRQSEVLNLIIQGQPNKVIANKLSLSENTVRGHVSIILKILNVSNRTEAAYAAAKVTKDQ